MIKYIAILLAIILSSCNTLSHVEVNIESKAEWKIAVTEYEIDEGYIQSDTIYYGYGDAVVKFKNNIPQYVYAWNFTDSSNIEIYEVYKNGKRVIASEKMSSGSVEWWRILNEVSIEDF